MRIKCVLTPSSGIFYFPAILMRAGCRRSQGQMFRCPQWQLAIFVGTGLIPGLVIFWGLCVNSAIPAQSSAGWAGSSEQAQGRFPARLRKLKMLWVGKNHERLFALNKMQNFSTPNWPKSSTSHSSSFEIKPNHTLSLHLANSLVQSIPTQLLPHCAKQGSGVCFGKKI